LFNPHFRTTIYGTHLKVVLTDNVEVVRDLGDDDTMNIPSPVLTFDHEIGADTTLKSPSALLRGPTRHRGGCSRDGRS
jgi:hypothetical protein